MRSWQEDVLAEHWGIREATVVPVSRGHTNESFAVCAGGARLVLRRAWAGKPSERISREERVLGHLGTPRIVPTSSGAARATVDDRVVHLFERCEGEPGPVWLDRGDARTMRSAMAMLAVLHRRLAAAPGARADSWTWLVERLDRVRTGDLGLLPPDASRVLALVDTLLEDAPPLGRPQWLHGDYHLGNLLFSEGLVTAAVDLDDTGRGSAAGEAAMALFALARQDAGEERFVFDADLWSSGVDAYGAEVPSAQELLPLFCAYQVLVHLEAAQHGWWTLGRGIGFWPCWNELIAAC